MTTRTAGRRPGRGLLPRLTGVAVVVGFMLAPVALAATAPSRVWIDAPLDGSVLPLAGVEVVAHAADDAGISDVELAVDGAVVGSAPGQRGERLITFRMRWLPAAAGVHVIAVRALNESGTWGLPASALVRIVDRGGPTASPSVEPGRTTGPSPSVAGVGGPSSGPTPTPEPGATPSPGLIGGPTPTPTHAPTPTPTAAPTRTPTAAPTPTPTPRPTPTPTPTPRPTPTPTPPCTPPPPDLILPENRGTVQDARPTFEWMYGQPPSCVPTRFRIQVADVSDFGHIVATGAVSGSTFFWTSNTDLAECVIHYWRVIPLRADGSAAPSSPIWTFHRIGRACPG